MPQVLARVRVKSTDTERMISKKSYQLNKKDYHLLEFVTDTGQQVQEKTTEKPSNQIKKSVVAEDAEVKTRKKPGPKPKVKDVQLKSEEHAKA